MMMPPSQLIIAPALLPRSGPSGSHFLAEGKFHRNLKVTFFLLTFAECDLSPVDDQASRTMQFLDWIRTVGQSIAVAALVPHRRASHAIARLERAWRSTDLHVTGGKGVVCQAVDLVG